MVSDKILLDLDANAADVDDGNYKSYFARSMAVNSQYRENKSAPSRTSNNGEQLQAKCEEIAVASGIEAPEVVRLRKDLRNPKWNGAGCGTTPSLAASNCSSRRASLCSNMRVQENPVENYLLQSQINTLQWQLKETESSREMYRAVMRQVVTFLERAHRSLELLGSRIKANTRLSRPQSEYCITTSADTLLGGTANEVPWSWKKKQSAYPEEIPPEKLSQEAYRLLRTAQSLLNTNEPDLVHTPTNTSIDDDDLTFLSQLAEEFPALPENKPPQRTTSFSLCPKLLTPEKVGREKHASSSSFNRKFSLQLNDTVRRNSFLREVNQSNRSIESSRSIVIDQCELITSTMLEDKTTKTATFKYTKSSSPAVSSVGSAEDESGFSSMNSFQEVGIPHTDHTRTLTDDNFRQFSDDLQLWQSPNVLHKRWSSTPVENLIIDKPPVLWV